MSVDLERENGLEYPSRAVIDTCVILNVVLGGNDNQPVGHLRRSKKLLNDAISGRLELIIPASVLVELSTNHLLLSGGAGYRDPVYRASKKLVMEWCQKSDLPGADLTTSAAEWFSEHPEVQGLRPGDASVLATAEYAKAEVIYTWDRQFRTIVNTAHQQGLIDILAQEPPEQPITLDV